MTSALVPSRISTVRATVELIRWSLIRNAINAPFLRWCRSFQPLHFFTASRSSCRILTGILQNIWHPVR